jgi:hypothetical protein
MSPQPGAAPLPCGSPHFETHRAARAPGAANVISPSEGVHTVAAQQCGFGRGVASRPQVSVALPALRRVAPTGSIAAAVADRGAVERPKNPTKSMLWRCCGSTGRIGAASAHMISARHFTETTARPFFPHPRHRTRS